MKPTLRQSYTWLHTWAGLLLGWLCFAIFLTGSLSYFRPEITRWMQPEQTQQVDLTTATEAAFQYLKTHAPDAKSWSINLPYERDSQLQIGWKPAAEGAEFQRKTLDPIIGEPIQIRESRGGELFYRFHFQLGLPYPWGRFLASFAGFFGLIAILSGLFAHRHLIKDFFTFRPGRRSIRSWLDFHNLAGVFTLPFCLVMLYSGIVTLMFMVFPWNVLKMYEGNPREFYKELRTQPSLAESASIATFPLPVHAYLEQAEAQWGDRNLIQHISIKNPASDDATTELSRRISESLSITQPTLILDAHNADILGEIKPIDTTAMRIRDGLYGLHVGRFAQESLRWVLFAISLLATGVVATGLIMWTVKRRPKQEMRRRLSLVHGFIERLNITTIVGLPIAIAAYFLANRILPAQLPHRIDIEEECFYWAWLICGVYTLGRRIIPAWRDLLMLASILWIAIPIVDAFTATQYLHLAWSRGNWSYLGFNLLSIITGFALFGAAQRVRFMAKQS